MEEGIKFSFESLPEGFVAEAIALTSPRDACRLSTVNSVFRSAAEWDPVWDKFLQQQKLAEIVDAGGGSKKEAFLRLCDHPIIIDEGSKSFWLDKRSGKKCYMLAARQLSIEYVDSPGCWRWASAEESRFREVAELISVCSLAITGMINTSILSPNTDYTTHLVFKTTPKAYGFEYQPVEVEVRVDGSDGDGAARMVYLDPQAGERRRVHHRRRIGLFSKGAFGVHDEAPSPSKENGPTRREDGWYEVQIGEYFNKAGDHIQLQMSVTELKGGNWKSGLIIQGIEIRPKGFCIQEM